MNIKLFLVIGLVLNTFIAVLFPMEVGLDDPLGLNDIREQKFSNTGYFTTQINETYTNESIGFFTTDGKVKKLDQSIENATSISETGDQFFLSEISGFGFLDYVRVVLSAIKSIFIFLLIPVILFYNMGYPFNVLLGLPYSLLYLASILAFALGR